MCEERETDVIVRKGSDIGSVTENTGSFIRLSNPRTDKWHERFKIDGSQIAGRSDFGVTVRILRLNDEELRLKRASGLRAPAIISSARLWWLCLLRWLCNRPFRRPFHTCLRTEWAITS